MSYYYSDLSADSSSSGESEEEEDYCSLSGFGLSSGKQKKAPIHNNKTQQPQKDGEEKLSSTHSIILHLDLDCFYCACEEIDRKLEKSRPLAIGQKHIIVTSNYEARRWGVKKLQLREDAYKACPSLLIVEGSDLERYRRHSRNIYQVFRKCIQKDCFEKFGIGSGDKPTILPPVSRGRGMDEMQADISCLVDFLVSMKGHSDWGETSTKIFVYGDNAKQTTTLTEDQTGQQATVKPYRASLDAPPSYKGITQREHSNHQQQEVCQRRLLLAARTVGCFVQQTILNETGFTTTLGISVNPLLSKVASDLQKPMSVNVLYPWRSSQLIASMPLRKIPDAGRRTIQLLEPALERYHHGRGPKKAADSFWTCRDLLSLPKSEIQRALEEKTGAKEEQWKVLLQKCQGIDTTSIADDQGGLQKTISVENSFRRDTVTSPKAVWKGLEELYVRLPRLLNDRREWSNTPELAFPTTLRLTARTVDLHLVQAATTNKKRRRPFVTKSKQVPFPEGRALLRESNAAQQQTIIRTTVAPLVQALLLSHQHGSSDLNVTRLNIAVTNFKDIAGQSSLPRSSLPKSPNNSASQYANVRDNSSTSRRPSSQLSQSSPTNNKPSIKRAFSNMKEKRISSQTVVSTTRQPAHAQSAAFKRPRKDLTSLVENTVQSPKDGHCFADASSEINAEVLAELPPDIAQEVIRDYKQVLHHKNKHSTKRKAKPARIDQYFSRK